jgi:hypothetical protein
LSDTKRQYAANYRKPPLHTRFKKGQSGNPEPHRFAPADEEVIKHMVARIRGALLQEIQELNVGNPALAMISLPPAEPVGV